MKFYVLFKYKKEKNSFYPSFFPEFFPSCYLIKINRVCDGWILLCWLKGLYYYIRYNTIAFFLFTYYAFPGWIEYNTFIL